MLKWFALIFAAVSLAGCSNIIADYKYRLTLEVEADGQVYRGSSVVRVWLRKDSRGILSTGGVFPHARGEATVVDLGDGRLLVALLTRKDSGNVWMPGLSRRKNILSRDLTANELPPLVSFKDPSNPKTVFSVDPNNLAEAFGEGAKWRRIRVDLADGEPLTKKIEKQLPWLTGMDGLLDGHSTQKLGRGFANRIGTGSFRKR